jgi:predicted glycosyltransferase
MDFTALGISALLVPTPGQSEQEYLADRMSEKGWFRCVTQENLDLKKMQETGNLFINRESHPQPGKQDFRFVEDLYREYYQDSNKSQQETGVNL